MAIEDIIRQASYLARKNFEADPAIEEIYWIPDEEEVRLVEVMQSIPPSGEQIDAFYFRSDPSHNLPAPSGIALIRPDELRTKPLPEDWGGWHLARRINQVGEVED
jgi:hypothetical protein